MTTETTFTITGSEAATRHLMAQASKEMGNPPALLGIVEVFNALHYASLPLTRIVEVANVIQGVQYDPERIKSLLSAMVRGGYLRSRVSARVRLYEVNY